MKKFITIFSLIMVMVILFTACGEETSVPVGPIGQTNSATSDGRATTSPVVVTLPDGSTVTESGEDSTATTTSDSSVSATTTKAPAGSTVKPATTTTKKPTTTTKKPTTTTKKTTTTTKAPTTTGRKTYPLVLPNASQLSVIENEVIRLMNVERQGLGVAALTSEPLLIQGARIRANECKQASTFGHTRPNGTPWSTIFEQVKYGEPIEQMVSDDGVNWYPKTTYSTGPSAENLGSTDHSWDSSSDTFFDGYSCTTAQLKNTAKKLFEGWKASSGHYRNMKNAQYTKTGVGLYVCKYKVNADGSLLDGYDCIQFIAITLFTSK